MTRDEKLERAWKLVCLNDPSLSRPAIAAIAGVSDRVVGTMRAARDEFIRTKPRRNILDLTWDDIKRGGKRDTQFNDSWRERQAEAWVKGFKKNFGGKIIKHPEVFAMAIKLYSDSLPRRMIEGAWEDIAVEVVDAMREDEVEMRPAPGDDHDDDAF